MVTRCFLASIAWRQVGDDGADNLLHFARRDVEHFLLGVEPREPQQIGDEALHAAAVARDDFQEVPRLQRIGQFVDECFDVAADRCQRGAQLVRHVGDEVTANLIGPAEIGNVVEHEHGAAACTGHRRGACDEYAREVAPQRQLLRVHVVATQDAAAS